MPGSTPPTSQLDWLSSTTAMIVLLWSRATRDLLKSFGWGIVALHQLNTATKLPSLRRPPHRIFESRFQTSGVRTCITASHGLALLGRTEVAPTLETDLSFESASSSGESLRTIHSIGFDGRSAGRRAGRGSELGDAARRGDEFARHHDDRHRVLLGADLGDHLHPAQFEAGRVLHNHFRRLAQLLGGVELGFGLDQPRAFFA